MHGKIPIVRRDQRHPVDRLGFVYDEYIYPYLDRFVEKYVIIQPRKVRIERYVDEIAYFYDYEIEIFARTCNKIGCGGTLEIAC